MINKYNIIYSEWIVWLNGHQMQCGAVQRTVQHIVMWCLSLPIYRSVYIYIFRNSIFAPTPPSPRGGRSQFICDAWKYQIKNRLLKQVHCARCHLFVNTHWLIHSCSTDSVAGCCIQSRLRLIRYRDCVYRVAVYYIIRGCAAAVYTAILRRLQWTRDASCHSL